MPPSLIKKLLSLILNKNLVILFSLIFFFGLVFVCIAIYFQPIVGDDYQYRDMVTSSRNFIDYFNYRYFNWEGRFSLIILSYWVFSDSLNLLLYKLSVIPFILITFYFFLKKIINIKIKFFSIDFIILFICLWFTYPAIDQTIFWITGSFVYLMPLLFSIFYLGLFNKIDDKEKKNIFTNIFYLISSFLAGSSHLQAFVGCFVVSSYFIFLYYKKNKNRFKQLLPFYIVFLVGGAISISAPGNFVRLENPIFETSIISTFYKSVLFIATSIFYLGDIRSSLIYFLLIFLLFVLYSKKISFKILINKSNYIWVLAFLFSLMSMIPAINSISPRTIFFPIFFLTIFFLKLIFLKYDFNHQLKIKNISFYILVMLFILESFLGSLTNYVYKKEYDIRMNAIKDAKINNQDYAVVSHYTIIPSRLTHMLNPIHDQRDMNEISRKYQIKIKYNDNLPRSKNIRKDLKFYLD